MTTITPEHAARYRKYYAEHEIKKPVKPHPMHGPLMALMAETGAETVLDYGSGPAMQLAAFLPNVTSYDPGVETMLWKPDADIVLCHHVLEHCGSADEAAAVIEDVLKLARKVAVITVGIRQSTKLLHDGTPWHTLVWPSTRWRELIWFCAGMPPVWTMADMDSGDPREFGVTLRRK